MAKATSAKEEPTSAPPTLKEAASAASLPDNDKPNVVGSEKRGVDASHTKELAQGPRVDTTKALETVLHMEAPTSKKPEEHHLHHLHAPPYVHHFDMYSLVKDLEKGNFTEDQSITVMKAVRGLLAVNLDVAKEGLVSKSDVENVHRDSPAILSTRDFADSMVIGDILVSRRMLRTPD